MTEILYDSRRVRLLTIIDEGNREGLEIAMAVSLPSRRVVRVLNELVALHGRPSAVRVDNGLSQKSSRQGFAKPAVRQVKRRARDEDIQTASAACGEARSP